MSCVSASRFNRSRAACSVSALDLLAGVAPPTRRYVGVDGVGRGLGKNTFPLLEPRPSLYGEPAERRSGHFLVRYAEDRSPRSSFLLARSSRLPTTAVSISCGPMPFRTP